MDRDFRRFAILEHEWNGTHWDFLVEDGDFLRAWAIDEPIIADVELSARSLVPHRKRYLYYEGEISLGRGSVRRWDGGICEVEEWNDRRVLLEVQGSQIVGRVEFRCLVADDVRRWLFCFGKLS